MHLTYLILGIFTFVELNCENLFDARKDSVKDDTEYTAESLRRWTRTRYWNKLNSIAQEIISCGDDSNGWVLPDLVALCEVENDSVLNDLAHRSLLRNAGYEYVMTDSPDLRGIDVALLYSPFSFRLIHHYPIRIPPLGKRRPTRDILYVSGQLINGDTLHVFVVHAPSRFGGERSTRPHRLAVADRLMQSIDSIRTLSSKASIVVAGDFNDRYDSPALVKLCQHQLTNISQGVKGNHGAKGTYKYQGEWESIDHILVGGNILDAFQHCHIHDAPFLLEEDEQYGGAMPRRNYRGYKYNKGYSDHLPLVARFKI
ncbi:MAG: endonuclease/exonuclease/phosphatase family protein [Prevotella sp.]|nr:endonuclease/exonuclease/phosphatase family protein [Prevotella sp.]